MSNYILTADGELYHYGVPGMKWGKRKAQRESYAKRYARGHAGPGRYATTKRQLAGDKRDLEGLKNGQHLSVGLTKKRQAAYDAKDKARLEKRIAKNEAKLAAKDAKKQAKRDAQPNKTKKVIAIGAGIATGIIAGNIGGNMVSKLSGGSLVASGAASIAAGLASGRAVTSAIMNSGNKKE